VFGKRELGANEYARWLTSYDAGATQCDPIDRSRETINCVLHCTTTNVARNALLHREQLVATAVAELEQCVALCLCFVCLVLRRAVCV
jgi:hypothetical protein